MKIVYLLFDGRYRTDEDSAICYECCDTFSEAKENCSDYGNDTVIVQFNEMDNKLSNPKILN